MNVIDSSPYADDASSWQQVAQGRTAASLHAKSVAALRADSPDIALTLIEMALAGGAIDPLFRRHHATCLKILRRYAEAEKSYWDILRDHPESVEAMQGLRALYHAVGQCGVMMPSPARRTQSLRHQTARHWHRKAARQLRN